MKIFEIVWGDGEKEWIAANTTIQALKVYSSMTGVDLDDFEDDDNIIQTMDEGKQTPGYYCRNNV